MVFGGLCRDAASARCTLRQQDTKVVTKIFLQLRPTELSHTEGSLSLVVGGSTSFSAFFLCKLDPPATVFGRVLRRTKGT